MTKILKIALAIFICSLCGLFSSVVAQNPNGDTVTPDGRSFQVYTICRKSHNPKEGTWVAEVGWRTNTDILISSKIEGGIVGWNIIGYHPEDIMYENSSGSSFWLLLIDNRGFPLSGQGIMWTVTTYDGYESHTLADMSAPVCKITKPPTPAPIVASTPVPVVAVVQQAPVVAPVATSCPIVEIQYPSGNLVCLQSAPY